MNIVGNYRMIEGRENVSRYWKLLETSKILAHTTVPNEIIIKGVTAYNYGIYESVSLRNNDTITFSEQYLITRHKVNGK